MVAPLATWPWESLSSFKYALYGPFLAKILYTRHQEDSRQATWCLHILVLCALRGSMYNAWTSYSNMLFLTRNRRIIKQGIDFKQIDREWDWDNFILLQAGIASLIFCMFPALGNIPLWNTRGFIAAVVLHMAISEPFYYLTHKCFHGNYLFNNYHSLHHSSPVPQAFTAGHLTLFEHLFLAGVVGIPIVGACLLGFGSVMMIYSYVLMFDLLRSLGHCNIEIVPHQMFESFHFLRYLIYTPTYHSLHHSEMGTNFCLFMPLYDFLGKTLNSKSWDMHKKLSIDAGKNGRVPDFVFLAHVVDMTSALHVPFAFRSYGSMPFTTKVVLLPCLPLCFIIMLIMWAKSKTFLVTFYNLRGRLHQTWSVPRFGFQYFLPFAVDGINKHIEQAILRADRLGVKVISLAALNKNSPKPRKIVETASVSFSGFHQIFDEPYSGIVLKSKRPVESSVPLNGQMKFGTWNNGVVGNLTGMS